MLLSVIHQYTTFDYFLVFSNILGPIQNTSSNQTHPGKPRVNDNYEPVIQNGKYDGQVFRERPTSENRTVFQTTATISVS